MEQLCFNFTPVKIFNEDDIIKRILTSKKGAVKGLWLLYDQQRPDEIRAGRSIGNDDRGFNRFDSKELSRIARITKTTKTVSVEELMIIRHKLPKYAKQLCNIVNGRRI